MSDPALGASAFDRIPNEAYFTLDAKLAIDALRASFFLGQVVLEPCAGRGHLVKELRRHGLTVHAQDIIPYPDPLVPDILQDRDIYDIKSLAGFDTVVTNLPYDEQDAMLRHLLPIAKRDGCSVATLTRSAWHYAKRRRPLCADNLHFLGIVHLPRRPWWSDVRTSTPRFDFVWNIWTPHMRGWGIPPVMFCPKEQP